MQLVWFRRDLRTQDHHALYSALRSVKNIRSNENIDEYIVGVFIFDPDILKDFPNHPSLPLLHEAVLALRLELGKINIPLLIMHAPPLQAFEQICQDIVHASLQKITAIHSNIDYEPQAIRRDQSIANHFKDIEFIQYKDQVIFHQNEIVKADSLPYTIFTPYKNTWLKHLDASHYLPFAILKQIIAADLAQELANYTQKYPTPSLKEIGFKAYNPDFTQAIKSSFNDYSLTESRAQLCLQTFIPKMQDYANNRDYPALSGTSGLSLHLRFGTISIRQCVQVALQHKAHVWLSELIWREFYQQLLWHFPSIVDQAFKAKYRAINWSNNPVYFKAWCEGKTGYPIVDAAMRQLNQTGWMHNRLRMIVASFLCKDLLIDWRLGDAYFKEKLVDYDLAANNGGWQWSASTGCDAQPYFRIFNPILQSQKFDPSGDFIKRYLPELAALNAKDIHFPSYAKTNLPIKLGLDYPMPLVEHALQRKEALALYKI